MSSRNSAFVYLLSGWAVATFYGVYVLSITGGLLQDLFHASQQTPRLWPGTLVVMKDTIFGLGPVDWHLNNLISFWTPIIFRQREALNAFTPFFMLQWVSAFTFLNLECLREGNRGLAVGSFALLGSIVQLIGMGPLVTFYFLWHATKSPIADVKRVREGVSAILVPSSALKALPYSVIIGFVLPTIPWLLPTPSVILPRTMHLFQVFWQPFPLYMVGLRRLIESIWGASESLVPKKRIKTYISQVSDVYRLILGICLISQISTVFYIIFASDLSLRDVFLPPFPSSSWKMSSAANGVHVFLLWDYYGTGVSALIWALSIWKSAYTTTNPRSDIPWGRTVARVLIFLLLGGPIAAATDLLWERDTILSQGLEKGV